MFATASATLLLHSLGIHLMIQYKNSVSTRETSSRYSCACHEVVYMLLTCCIFYDIRTITIKHNILGPNS